MKKEKCIVLASRHGRDGQRFDGVAFSNLVAGAGMTIGYRGLYDMGPCEAWRCEQLSSLWSQFLFLG